MKEHDIFKAYSLPLKLFRWKICERTFIVTKEAYYVKDSSTAKDPGIEMSWYILD